MQEHIVVSTPVQPIDLQKASVGGTQPLDDDELEELLDDEVTHAPPLPDRQGPPDNWQPGVALAKQHSV